MVNNLRFVYTNKQQEFGVVGFFYLSSALFWPLIVPMKRYLAFYLLYAPLFTSWFYLCLWVLCWESCVHWSFLAKQTLIRGMRVNQMASIIYIPLKNMLNWTVKCCYIIYVLKVKSCSLSQSALSTILFFLNVISINTCANKSSKY